MTPGARIQAAIELLDRIIGSTNAADNLTRDFFRSRRYAGSKDRKSITNTIYDILRHQGEFTWWAKSSDSRALMLAYLVVQSNLTFTDTAELFDGKKFCPSSLNCKEQNLLQQILQTKASGTKPVWVDCNYPEWLGPRLIRRFGSELKNEIRALADRAAVDLRVNLLKSTPIRVASSLAANGIETNPSSFANTALRLTKPIMMSKHPLFLNGTIEIQDEGSQIVTLLVGVEPGQQVVDYCAGAGGKSLALAANMENKGQIFAFDSDSRRLKPLRARMQRARARNIQAHPLGSQVAITALTELTGKTDRILLDVPCSGSGTWRRNPENKWRLQPEQLARYIATQSKILRSTAPLVRQGGRLIYATCSILMDENEDQIDRFLGEHPEFRLIPLSQAWGEATTKFGDYLCPSEDPYLRLTPAQHNTDGFFAAVLERNA